VFAAVTITDLLYVVVAASAAGVGVTAIYSMALLGAARTMVARREGRSPGLWVVLTFVCGVGVLAAAALGIYAVAR
jgi:uncharacterized membrane protein YhaH (DUF805 family)